MLAACQFYHDDKTGIHGMLYQMANIHLLVNTFDSTPEAFVIINNSSDLLPIRVPLYSMLVSNDLRLFQYRFGEVIPWAMKVSLLHRRNIAFLLHEDNTEINRSYSFFLAVAD